MSQLKQLMENIQIPSTEFIKVDKSFFADEKIEYRKPSNFNFELSNQNYIYSILSNNLTTLLLANWIQTNSDILEVPKIAWPDFVIWIKNIYDISDKTKYKLPELAKEIELIINNNIDQLKYIKEIKLLGIYINIYTNDNYKSEVLTQISNLNKDYGNIYIPEFTGKNIIAEFPSCNTAKAMWVHHVRAMVIGQVWNNIISKTWANICRWNYLGDRGTPFGKLFYSIQNTAKTNPDIYTQIESRPNENLGNLYADFKKIEDENKEDIARSYFARLENGDTNMIALWRYIRKLSLQDFQNIFDKFGVETDCSIWESYAQLFESQVVEDLQNANILHDSQWALVVKFIRQDGELKLLEVWESEPETQEWKDSMEIFIIKKSDWSTNYATRDLWLMKLRGQNQADKIYICTDNGQSLHFKLINILAVKLWYIADNVFTHIPFWLLLSGGEKMSTRWGKLFRLEDLINETAAKNIERFSIEQQEAEKLAIAAIIFNDIKWDINKDVAFDIDLATNPSWDSGIYLKGTRKRLEWLISKLDLVDFWPYKSQDPIDFANLNDKPICDIIVKLSYISQVYSDSIALVKPHIVTQYILSLCWDINSRYNNWPKILELPLEDQKVYSYILHNIYIWLSNLFDTIQIKSE